MAYRHIDVGREVAQRGLVYRISFGNVYGDCARELACRGHHSIQQRCAFGSGNLIEAAYQLACMEAEIGAQWRDDVREVTLGFHFEAFGAGEDAAIRDFVRQYRVGTCAQDEVSFLGHDTAHFVFALHGVIFLVFVFLADAEVFLHGGYPFVDVGELARQFLASAGICGCPLGGGCAHIRIDVYGGV